MMLLGSTGQGMRSPLPASLASNTVMPTPPSMPLCVLSAQEAAYYQPRVHRPPAEASLPPSSASARPVSAGDLVLPRWPNNNTSVVRYLFDYIHNASFVPPEGGMPRASVSFVEGRGLDADVSYNLN